MKIDKSKAHSYIIVDNHSEDPTYAPYCMRCSSFHRMTVVEPYLFKHRCGAVHDERQVIIKETTNVS